MDVVLIIQMRKLKFTEITNPVNISSSYVEELRIQCGLCMTPEYKLSTQHHLFLGGTLVIFSVAWTHKHHLETWWHWNLRMQEWLLH